MSGDTLRDRKLELVVDNTLDVKAIEAQIRIEELMRAQAFVELEMTSAAREKAWDKFQEVDSNLTILKGRLKMAQGK